MVDILQLATFVVVVLIAVAWYLSYSAARLDRLHAKVEGAMSALDAQLIRRAESALELANSGVLDPASALLIADAATESLERTTEHPVTDDLLDGQHFGGREHVESDLTAALEAALPEDVVRDLSARDGDLVGDTLGRVASSGLRVQLARRFHNDAVRDTLALRERPAVRVLRLGGTAALPTYFEIAERAEASPREVGLVRRVSARVVLLDDDGCVLLFCGSDPALSLVRHLLPQSPERTPRSASGRHPMPH